MDTEFLKTRQILSTKLGRPHNLLALPNIIRVITSRRMRWVGHVMCMGEMINTYNILVGKPGGKRPLRRP
jgi:hypothetical protein